MLPLAAGAAVTLGSLTSAALGQTWLGATGTFTTNANWVGGAAPALGTLATPVNLTFTQGNAGGTSATNNIGSPWVANWLSFNVNNTFSLAGTSGFSFQLVGPSPFINMNGVGNATMSSTGANILLADNLTFGGSGPGNLSLVGAITETGGAKSVTIPGGAALRMLRMVTLGNGSNGFSGGLTLDGGTVATAGFGPATFGAAGSTLTVTANGGTINDNANLSNGINLGTIQLNGDLHVIGVGSQMPLFSTTSTLLNGTGALIVNTTNSTSMALASNSTGFTGALVIDQSELPQFIGNAGGLALSAIGGLNAVNGAITGVPTIDIRAGGALNLTNGLPNSLQNGDRIGDTTPVRIRSAYFTLSGPAAAGTSGFNPAPLMENIGTLSGAGMAVVSVFSGTGAVTTTLNASTLSRVDGGTFLFRGTSLGDGTVATRGNITFTSDPSGSLVGGGGGVGTDTISILPYAIGGTATTDNGSSFVTYGANGIRPLAAAEYLLDDLTGAVPAANVKLDNASSGVSTTTTVNSLLLATNGSVTGAGILNVTSGAILCTSTAAATISPTVAFGSTEGVIYCTGTGSLTISGPLTGSNGLTKSGASVPGASPNTTLTLTGTNTGLTGPLTINAGTINVNALAALPGTGTITVNGSHVTVNGATAGLVYSGTTPLTLGRAVAVGTGYATFNALDTGTGGSLTLDQQISGVGSVNLQGVSSGADIFVTNPGNTYAGKTRFAAGNIHIAGDGSTGVNGGWSFGNGATLTLEGNVTNSRTVNFEGGAAGATINTNGHNMTLSGPIVSFTSNTLTAATTGGITKNGAGTLTLTNAANTLSLSVTVNGGTLLVNGNLGANTAAGGLTVNSGATLGGSGTIYRNTVISSGGTLSPGNSPGILTIWGSLNMAAPVTTPAATLVMQLNGPTPGTGYDQIQTFLQNAPAASGPGTAQLSLGGAETPTPTTQAANLQLTLGFNPAPNSVFWLIINSNKYQDNFTADATHWKNITTGTFAGLPEGSPITLGIVGGVTYAGIISYHGDYDTNNPSGGTGNDVVIYGVHGCGSADFNCDGDVGTDADIEAFFSCLAGNCPSAPCANSADFNGDGDVGTDSDIEAFFRVLGGGSC
jgi:autotransporter-associated beta strand protein